MTILNETARLVKDRLALEYEDITIERLVVEFYSYVRVIRGEGGWIIFIFPLAC
jgi:hypothetical protein